MMPLRMILFPLHTAIKKFFNHLQLSITKQIMEMQLVSIKDFVQHRESIFVFLMEMIFIQFLENFKSNWNFLSTTLEKNTVL